MQCANQSTVFRVNKNFQSVHVPKLKLIHILSEIYDDLCVELKLDILLCSEKNVIVHYFSVIQCAKQHTGFG